jgi:hypothetical protein
MARDILSEFGPEAKSSGSRACGGVKEAKELPYSPPVGPKHQTTGPGLGHNNHGNAGTQTKR